MGMVSGKPKLSESDREYIAKQTSLTPSEVEAQCTERILNKIAKPLNETFIGLMCMLQDSEYVLFEILD